MEAPRQEVSLRHRLSILAVLVLCGPLAFGTGISEGGSLRVGTARVDITPAPDAALPMAGYASRTVGFKGIHDHVFVRAIVVDVSVSQAALVAWESLFVPREDNDGCFYSRWAESGHVPWPSRGSRADATNGIQVH
jgi:hypothetical protein